MIWLPLYSVIFLQIIFYSFFSSVSLGQVKFKETSEDKQVQVQVQSEPEPPGSS